MLKRKLFGVEMACGRCDRIFKTHESNSAAVCPHCGCRGSRDNVNFVSSEDRTMCQNCGAWGQDPIRLLRSGCNSCGRRVRSVTDLFHHP